jgi:hypothetical protein
MLKPIFAALVVLGSASVASALQFTITIENLGPQPFSPIFVASTNSSFDLFTAGAAAPLRIERIAEDGNASVAAADAAAAATAGNILDWEVIGSMPIPPGESRTFTLEATTTFRWFQWASMLGMSNDAFIGSGLGFGDRQIDLFNDNVPLDASFTISFLDVWDAGTELNTEAAADLVAFGNPLVGPAEGGIVRTPHSGIRGDGAIASSFDWYGEDVARITIAPVPEPATLAVVGLGVAALLRRRKKS